MPGWLKVRVDPANSLFRHELVEALEREGFQVHIGEQIDVRNTDLVVKVVTVEGGRASAWTVARALSRFRERRKIGPRVVIIDAETE
jgi:hypothetical protein